MLHAGQAGTLELTGRTDSPYRPLRSADLYTEALLDRKPQVFDLFLRLLERLFHRHESSRSRENDAIFSTVIDRSCMRPAWPTTR